MKFTCAWKSVFVSLAVSAGVGAAGVARGEGFLHTQGEDIVDGSGQKVMLRGMSLGNWALPEGYMWQFYGGGADRPRRIEKLVSDLIGPEDAAAFWKAYRKDYINEADIARIAELGFNSVRPSLNARLFLSEGDNPTYQEEGFALVDNLVKWSKAHGIYVFIDMHAAPGGETGQNIDDSTTDEPLLFMDKKYQDRLVDLWVKIATRYKDDPTVAGYDLLNEPLPDKTGAAKKYKDQLEPLYKRITQAIRKVDTKHMITVEGCNWANDWSVFTAPPFDSNLVYQFHYYCWANPTNLNSIDQYLKAQKNLKAPIWVGETGERDDTIYWATTDYFEANNIGWSFWPWKKMGNNQPCVVKQPKDWDLITGYSSGENKTKPSKETAERIFAELLHNVQLENCVFQPEVVNSLLHRAPVRIEAENYGHGGADVSYSVRDPKQLSALYRKSEPVLVVPVEGNGGRRRGGGQAIQLNAREWTAYTINSDEEKSYAVTIKVKTDHYPAALRVSINDADADHSQKTAISEMGWLELKLNPVTLKKGANKVKFSCENGTVTFDWIEFK